MKGSLICVSLLSWCGLTSAASTLDWGEVSTGMAPITGPPSNGGLTDMGAVVLLNGAVVFMGGKRSGLVKCAGGSAAADPYIADSDGTACTAGGGIYDTTRNEAVYTIAPGASTLTVTTANTGWPWTQSAVAVRLIGTDTFFSIGGSGNPTRNDAWKSTDKGLTFTSTSTTVFSASLGRTGHGCVSTSGTKLACFGGTPGGISGEYQNDVRISVNSGVDWATADHSACASPAMWPVRSGFGFTYMPIMGRIVLAGGRLITHVTSGSFVVAWHNDVWVSDDGGTCWLEIKADTNAANEGYFGSKLVVASVNGAEALIRAGGVKAPSSTFLTTVQMSVDGGATWSDVANTGTAWPPRDAGFALVVDTSVNRILMFGGHLGDNHSAPYDPTGLVASDLWTAPTSTLSTPTPAPVTSAPVTAAPVTVAPGTAAPGTSAPVTAAPGATTSAPATAAPGTTMAPVTSAPSASSATATFIATATVATVGLVLATLA